MSDSSSFASSWPRSRGPLIVDEEEVDALVAEESIVTDDGILHTGGELSQVPSFDEGDGDLNDSFSTGSLSEDTEHNANDLQTESVSSSSQMVMNDSDTEDDSSDDSSIEVLEITRVHSFEKLVDVDGLKHLKATSSPSRDADGKLLASSSSLPKLQRLNDTYISANANEVPTSSSSSSIVGKDEWIPSKAYDATLTVGAMPSKSRGVRFRDANMTDLSVFCQKQPVAHPNKSMLPDMEFFFQLASDYIEGKDRPVKVDRQPFYNQLSSYKDYLEQRLKSTWVDVLHNFMLHLKVPLNQHREVIRFPSTCDIPDSTGKIENIILATPDYPVIKTFRQLPLYSFVMLLPKEIVSESNAELTYNKLKSLSSSNIRFAFVFPKLFHKCTECKDEKHLIMRCDEDFLEHSMADREVYVVPIMNNVEYLQQLQILRRANRSNPLPCLTALSLGGSSMNKFQLHYFLNNFHPKKPIVNVSVLLQKLNDISNIPVNKATLIHTEAVLKMEQFRLKNKAQLSSLEKPLNNLIEKWKAIMKEVETTRTLPNAAVDALRKKFVPQLSSFSRLYDSIGKESLILHEVADMKKFKDLLPGLAVILSADRPTVARRVLVCVRGAENVVDELYGSVGQISSSPTNLRIKRAKGDNYVVPLLSNASNLTFQFTTIRNWAEYRMKNGVDMEKDDTFYFDMVMIVDLDRNIYELDTLIPMCFKAKQLVVFSNEGSENRVHLYRILSNINKAPVELTPQNSEQDINTSPESVVQQPSIASSAPVSRSNSSASTTNKDSSNTLFSVKKIEPEKMPSSRNDHVKLAVVGSKRPYEPSHAISQVSTSSNLSNKRGKEVDYQPPPASAKAAIPIRVMQLDFNPPSSRGGIPNREPQKSDLSRDNRKDSYQHNDHYDSRNDHYRRK